MSDIVVLYSGGADSMLMLKLAKMAKRDPYCVLIDYGQKHIKELEYAQNQLEGESIRYQTIEVDGFRVNSGLTGDCIKGDYEGVSEYHVPARNSIFLTIAAGIAESKGIKEIWIGCDMSDFYDEFPDCKQEYIGKMNEAFKVAFSYPIKIIAPLLGFEKEIILEILKESYNIHPVELYSGYEEAEPKCTCKYGSCDVPTDKCPIEKGEF